jgi:hypothetical protein
MTFELLGKARPSIPMGDMERRRPRGDETPDFTMGDVVLHYQFGEGKMAAVRPKGDDQVVTVAFKKAGTREFIATTGILDWV